MRRVTYLMNVSLDGYITDPAGSLDWSVPSREVFRFHIDQIRGVDVHLLGRRLYETMLYWETADQNPDADADDLEWTAEVPRRLLQLLTGHRRPTGIGQSRGGDHTSSSGGEGQIAIGGPDLASQAAELDLIDEYRLVVYPVLLGGGTSYFPQGARKVDLDLVETRLFEGGITYWRYQVRR